MDRLKALRGDLLMMAAAFAFVALLLWFVP